VSASSRKLARLLGVLESGEMLAARVAWRQARQAPMPWMTRALTVQAAQERGHAAMAAAAAKLIDSRAPRPAMLAAIARQLEHDLDHGRLANSLLGLQGVVEHLGEALLEVLGERSHPAGALLHALRGKVLAQERGHVRLGARCLQTLGRGDHAVLDGYRALGRVVAHEVACVVDDTRFDAQVYWTNVDQRLSAWHAQVAAAP
jgi:hypothetical protein